MRREDSIVAKTSSRFFKSKLTFFSSIGDYERTQNRLLAKRYSLKWWIFRLLNAAVCFGLIAIGLSLFGCAAKVEYRDVYIPQKCLVEDIKRPSPTGDILKDNARILKYTEMLEANIDRCK